MCILLLHYTFQTLHSFNDSRNAFSSKSVSVSGILTLSVTGSLRLRLNIPRIDRPDTVYSLCSTTTVAFLGVVFIRLQNVLTSCGVRKKIFLIIMFSIFHSSFLIVNCCCKETCG